MFECGACSKAENPKIPDNSPDRALCGAAAGFERYSRHGLEWTGPNKNNRESRLRHQHFQTLNPSTTHHQHQPQCPAKEREGAARRAGARTRAARPRRGSSSRSAACTATSAALRRASGAFPPTRHGRQLYHCLPCTHAYSAPVPTLHPCLPRTPTYPSPLRLY